VNTGRHARTGLARVTHMLYPPSYLSMLLSDIDDDELWTLLVQLAPPPEASAQQALLLYRGLPPEVVDSGLRETCTTRIGDARLVLALTGRGAGSVGLDRLAPVRRRLPQSRREAAPSYLCDTTLLARPDGTPLALFRQRSTIGPGRMVQPSEKEQDAVRRTGDLVDWRGSLRAIEQSIPDSVSVITVGDRESNVHAMFAEPRPAHSHLLVRAFGERRLRGDDNTFVDELADAPLVAEETLSLKYHAFRKPRPARLRMQAKQAVLQPPALHARGGPIELTALRVTEVDVPKSQKAVNWLLLTDLPLSSPDDAVRLVGYYNERWLVHRYNYILRSGCREAQCEAMDAEMLCQQIAAFGVMAWRVLCLEHPAYRDSRGPCTDAISETEWRATVRRWHTGHDPSAPPPNLSEAIRALASAEGLWDGRTGGYPSQESLWRAVVGTTASVVFMWLDDRSPGDEQDDDDEDAQA